MAAAFAAADGDESDLPRRPLGRATSIAGACIGTGLAVVWPAALELARARFAKRVPDSPSTGSRRDADHPAPLERRAPRGRSGACVATLHVVSPDLEPRSRRLSEYANGPYGYLMTLAFLALGIGMVLSRRRCTTQRERRLVPGSVRRGSPSPEPGW